ncbi:hypothetical protein ABH935_001441 [Catenulispora sp. GAS73]|uniref:ricin-type beta-trefoil lectin domain protein n=1 Tax=Catenulispora sp. GAS73 TaxID=3156269 RepID=UPI003518593A
MVSARMRSASHALRRPRVAITLALSLGAVVAGAGTSFAAASPITGPVYGLHGLCLDDTALGTSDGNPVQIYQCNNGANQQWTLTNPQFGANTTATVYGKCLDAKGGGTGNGTAVVLSTCTGAADQEWTLEYSGTWVNVNSGKCLDDPAYGGSGTALQIWDCNNGNNQVWHAAGLPTG